MSNQPLITITVDTAVLVVQHLKNCEAAEDKTIVLLQADNHRIDDTGVQSNSRYKKIKERERLARTKRRNSRNISKAKARKKNIRKLWQGINDQSIQRQAIAAMA